MSDLLYRDLFTQERDAADKQEALRQKMEEQRTTELLRQMQMRKLAQELRQGQSADDSANLQMNIMDPPMATLPDAPPSAPANGGQAALKLRLMMDASHAKQAAAAARASANNYTPFGGTGLPAASEPPLPTAPDAAPSSAPTDAPVSGGMLDAPSADGAAPGGGSAPDLNLFPDAAGVTPPPPIAKAAPSVAPAAPVAPSGVAGLSPDAIARIDAVGTKFGRVAASAQMRKEMDALVKPKPEDRLAEAVAKAKALNELSPRHIDPLSPEGIAATTARQKALNEVKPPVGANGLDSELRSKESDLRGFVDANIGIPLEQLTDPKQKWKIYGTDAKGNPTENGEVVVIKRDGAEPVLVSSKVYRNYVQKATTFADLRNKRAAMGAPAPGGSTAPAVTPATVTPTRVTSSSDYNALPSGAVYIDPDGTTRQKP